MKIYAVFIVSFLLLESCSHLRKDDCNKLRNGQFYYKRKKAVSGNIIERKGLIQIVTSEQTGKKDTELVKWLDPCTYELKPFSDRLNGSAENEIEPLRISILRITKKYYTVNVSIESEKISFNDTMWIVYLVGGMKSIGEVFPADK